MLRQCPERRAKQQFPWAHQGQQKSSCKEKIFRKAVQRPTGSFDRGFADSMPEPVNRERQRAISVRDKMHAFIDAECAGCTLSKAILTALRRRTPPWCRISPSAPGRRGGWHNRGGQEKCRQLGKTRPTGRGRARRRWATHGRRDSLFEPAGYACSSCFDVETAAPAIAQLQTAALAAIPAANQRFHRDFHRRCCSFNCGSRMYCGFNRGNRKSCCFNAPVHPEIVSSADSAGASPIGASRGPSEPRYP